MMDVDDIRGIIKSAAHADISDRGIFSDYDPYIPEKYREDVHAAFDVYYRIKYRKRKTADAGDDVTQQEGDAVRLLRDSMRKEYGWRMNFLPRRNIK